MLNTILTQKIIEKGFVSESDREIYIYGFDVVIYTIWSTAVLLLIGLFLRQFISSLILVFGFYTFQTAGGGYHANTHLKCLFTMIAGLFAGSSFIFLKQYPILLWGLTGFGALLLLLVPLVLHPNKAYLETERERLMIRSIMVTLSVLMSVIVLNAFWNRLLYAFSAVFLFSGISRIAGKIVYTRRKR